MATAASMPMIPTTIMSSTRVNPRLLVAVELIYVSIALGHWPTACELAQASGPDTHTSRISRFNTILDCEKRPFACVAVWQREGAIVQDVNAGTGAGSASCSLGSRCDGRRQGCPLLVQGWHLQPALLTWSSSAHCANTWTCE
jgi:hypothetical protein